MKKTFFITFFYITNLIFVFSQNNQEYDQKIKNLESEINDLKNKLSVVENFVTIKDGCFIFNDKNKENKIMITFNDYIYGIEFLNNKNESPLRIYYSKLINEPIIEINKSNENKKYIWSNSFILSESDWAMNYVNTRFNNLGYLSDKLKKTSFFVSHEYNTNTYKDVIFIEINTENQPTWNYYIGDGKFSLSDREIKVAYKEATEFVIKNIISQYIDKYITNYDLIIFYYFRGSYICKLLNGEIILDGE